MHAIKIDEPKRREFSRAGARAVMLNLPSIIHPRMPIARIDPNDVLRGICYSYERRARFIRCGCQRYWGIPRRAAIAGMTIDGIATEVTKDDMHVRAITNDHRVCTHQRS